MSHDKIFLKNSTNVRTCIYINDILYIDILYIYFINNTKMVYNDIHFILVISSIYFTNVKNKINISIFMWYTNEKNCHVTKFTNMTIILQFIIIFLRLDCALWYKINSFSFMKLYGIYYQDQMW